MSDGRVLVVGTTPDYVALIRERYPRRVLFLTDVSQYAGTSGFRPGDTDEVLCDLQDTENVISVLREQLEERCLRLTGVAGFDCEWLVLAAVIAQRFDLPFPQPAAVRLSRDKHQTKLKWSEFGVPCPKTELIRSTGQAARFVKKLGRPAVFKPLTGSGSELTFRCDNRSEVEPLLRTISKGLVQRDRLPLYRADAVEGGEVAGGLSVLVEEFVEGPEFSADFIVEGDRVSVIRVARKIRDGSLPFGTTTAYVVPASLPEPLNHEDLGRKLGEAARALGLSRAICMVDFIVRKEEVVFLELTPRIGGDCLPPLVRQCCGLDTIGLALDFAENRPWHLPPAEQWRPLVGLRLLARQRGAISGFKVSALSDDSRVKEVYLKRTPGHRVNLPPEDYDSWVLGHVIFEPQPGESAERQCEDLRQMFVVDMERKDGTELSRVHNASRGAV